MPTKIPAYFILLRTRENRTRAQMKGESVFAADIGTEQPTDNVVCESHSPWVLSSFSLQLSSSTKGSRAVVLFLTITSIIYDNETKRCVLCSSSLIRGKFTTMMICESILARMAFYFSQSLLTENDKVLTGGMMGHSFFEQSKVLMPVFVLTRFEVLIYSRWCFLFV